MVCCQSSLIMHCDGTHPWNLPESLGLWDSEVTMAAAARHISNSFSSTAVSNDSDHTLDEQAHAWIPPIE